MQSRLAHWPGLPSRATTPPRKFAPATPVPAAWSAGAAGVVCCDGTVDVYNPKCVRASAGALFHVPVVVGGDAVTVVEAIRASGRPCFGTAVGRGTDYTEADLAASVALVVGNEANGLPAGLESHLDGLVHIPMEGRSESINVGILAADLESGGTATAEVWTGGSSPADSTHSVTASG